MVLPRRRRRSFPFQDPRGFVKSRPVGSDALDYLIRFGPGNMVPVRKVPNFVSQRVRAFLSIIRYAH
jgi:hypothetical protein